LQTHDGALEVAFRKALFQTLAICTTTGFVTDDYGAWPIFGQALLVFFMFTGGCAGSTSGGMKLSRILILWKAALIEITHTVKPHAVRIVKLGRSAVRDEVVKQVFAYAVIFFVTVFVCMLALALEGVDLVTSFAGAVACVGNVGPGLGGVGPAEHYGHLSSVSKVVLSLGMMLGRLEFFTVLALVLPNLGGRSR
jgi:trk system potassium uptake protein TrkH